MRLRYPAFPSAPALSLPPIYRPSLLQHQRTAATLPDSPSLHIPSNLSLSFVKLTFEFPAVTPRFIMAIMLQGPGLHINTRLCYALKRYILIYTILACSGNRLPLVHTPNTPRSVSLLSQLSTTQYKPCCPLWLHPVVVPVSQCLVHTVLGNCRVPRSPKQEPSFMFLPPIRSRYCGNVACYFVGRDVKQTQ